MCSILWGRDPPNLLFFRPIPADGEALVDEYNAELSRLEENGKNTWFTAPWLYAEYGIPQFRFPTPFSPMPVASF
jgi:hypothetical protein